MHALILLVIIFLRVNSSTPCKSFKNVSMTVVPKDGDKYHTAVSGCLERKEFETTIIEIYIQKQRIPKLETDAIRHLRQLLILSLDDCELEVMEVAVFRNVPLLRKVRIVHNPLKEILQGTFSILEGLEILDLSNNKIERIENGTLGDSKTLKEVLLGFNNLEVYSDEWFRNATNIQVLDFQHNKIRAVPRRAFRSFPRIRKICFDYNELEVIHPEAFEGVTRLRFLGLRHNRLKSIHARIFPNSAVIDIMRIDANYLNYLPTRFLGLVEVREMALSGNPWKCPCLDQINNWLFQNNGSVKDPEVCRGKNAPVCIYPFTFSSSCRETIDEEITRNYLEKLKLINPPLDQICARLD